MQKTILDFEKPRRRNKQYLRVLQDMFVAGEIGRHTAIDENILDTVAGCGATVVERVDLVAQQPAGLKEMDSCTKNSIKIQKCQKQILVREGSRKTKPLRAHDGGLVVCAGMKNHDILPRREGGGKKELRVGTCP
jgi:hypothetical protein